MNGPSSYLVLCTTEGCQEPAQYKIAAVWNDGTTGELKTYGLCCENHLEPQIRISRDKQKKCRLTEGETLSQPQVFRLESGRRDHELTRLTDIEARFQS
jgi:hypothetical protein